MQHWIINTVYVSSWGRSVDTTYNAGKLMLMIFPALCINQCYTWYVVYVVLNKHVFYCPLYQKGPVGCIDINKEGNCGVLAYHVRPFSTLQLVSIVCNLWRGIFGSFLFGTISNPMAFIRIFFQYWIFLKGYIAHSGSLNSSANFPHPCMAFGKSICTDYAPRYSAK